MPDISNTTWEDIFKEIILTYGQIGIIVVVGLLSVVLGGVLVWVYLTKIKYVLMETEMANTKQINENLTKEINDATSKISALETELEDLKKEIADIQGYRFARQATKSDAPDKALKQFVGKENNT